MIELEKISFSYNTHPFIEEFNLMVKQGEILSIVGPNGSGKSTILKNITKKLNYSQGSIFIEEEDIKNLSLKSLAKKLASLSQHHASPPDFTVKQLVNYGKVPHKRWYQPLTKADEEHIHWAMKKTGVHHLANQPVAALSGGERQRVWIAMTLAQNTKILLLDEPTTFLDICHQIEVLDLIAELNRELQMTVVMVLHDLNQACQYSHRVCVMKKGKVFDIGVPEKIFSSDLIREVYNVEAVVECDDDGKVYIRPIKVFKGEKKSVK